MPAWPGFIGGSNTSQAWILDAEKTVNLFVEPAQAKAAKNGAALLPTPGFSAWAPGNAITEVGSRGSIVADGRLFWVIGGGLYEFSSTAVATRLGTVAQDSNPAQLVYNGKVGGQVGIASGGSVYTFTLATNTFAGPHFGAAAATMLNYADGYGLLFDANTGKVYLSALNDLTSWSSGTFFQRSKFPDPWQTMFVDPNGLIWLIGTDTFEVWYDANPASTQPWAPLSGLFGRTGIASRFAYAVSGSGTSWLARSAEGGVKIVMTRGSSPQPVSTYAVNTALASYRRQGFLADADLLIYEDQGHTFFNYSFPSAHGTHTFDATNTNWAERGQWNSAMGRYDAWAPRGHQDCFNKHLVGDRSSGTIWEMDQAYFTDMDGNGIRRLRRAPAISDEYKRHPIERVQIVMDTGVADQSLDPQVMFRISENGGRTFGNERQASFGRTGEYGRMVTFDRLGAPANAVIECAWTDRAPTRVIDAYVNNTEKAA